MTSNLYSKHSRLLSLNDEKISVCLLAIDFIECHHDSANFKQVWFALTALAIDFIECHHDSANFKQVWFALTALAILQIFVCAKKGSSSTK